jgi:DNA-directed RNA polymerase subunit RPC12/RpoP
MPLYPIYTMGIQAHCSDLIIDPTDPEIVHFLSICGYQITVKGIIANLLEHCGAIIEIDGEEHDLICSGMGYRVLVKKLPSGLAHAMIIPKPALPGYQDDKNQTRFSIITREKKDIPILFFRHLDEKTEIPIDPSWVRWLWRTFQKEKWLFKLKTLAGDFKGYLFDYHEARLHELISDAIKNKTPEIIECMTWKGVNDGSNDSTQRLSS